MRYIFSLIVFTLIFVSFTNAQEISREQKMQKIFELNAQIKNAVKDFLAPDAADVSEAEKNGFEVFRIMPRGKLNEKVGIRGGGAYYSFKTKSHDYDDTPQIQLEQNNLSVGFYGASYGFISDLGNLPLSSINKDTAEVFPLLNYQPSQIESEVRAEYRNFYSRQNVNGVNYTKTLPATIGHSYILRAISFDEADTLVAFKIHRKDSDGSLIIFWKKLKEFEKPTLLRNSASLD